MQLRNNKGQFIKGYNPNPRKDNWTMVLCPCGKEHKARFSRIKIGKEKYCSRKCSDKYREKVVWNKGKFDLNTYYGIHNWVKANRGKATTCEQCGRIDYISWANKSNQYKKDLNDWIQLCKKCHFEHDKDFFGIRKEIYG